MASGGASWADGPLRAISIETTGDDVETARIVAVAVVFVGGDTAIEHVNLVVDPGIPIPAEATARHGITTARARAEGVTPVQALETVLTEIQNCWAGRLALIGFDITTTLTVLDRELRRHLGRGIAVAGPVIDPQLIDLAVAPGKRPRTLPETCRHYQVRHERHHDPVEDALAAARLAWRLAKRFPRKIGGKSLTDLHRQQDDWAFDGHKPAWPLVPNSTPDPAWTSDVLDAIHTKIRADWAAALNTKGPHPFQEELHVVNDTRADHPYFTSVRALIHHFGHNDAQLIARMGSFARSMAADRIVIAWEPRSMQLALIRPGMPPPMPEHRNKVHVLDVVLGVPTRLRRYPYTPPSRDGTRQFSWGATETVEQPIDNLEPMVEVMIKFWREPIGTPKSEHDWAWYFRKTGYELTETPRPGR